MKITKNPAKLAFIYSVASVILGPLIFMLGYSFTRGGGDYCDAIYFLSDGSLDPRRITEFHNAQVFQVTGAGIMLGLGITILTYIFIAHYRKQTKINIWAILTVLLMMLGYIAVILMSGKSGQVC
jgi:hypothetical protein